ncbi:MAG: hypothetical protein SFU86_04555 [Pirellulaceae bacterium]|nr:hypothetical protein [Pirellulaceae bacterium]
MKRFERFTFRGRQYKFLNWETDGSVHAIDIKAEREIWLIGVALTRVARERENFDWMRSQREARAAARITRASWVREMEANKERLQRESEQILMSIPAFRELFFHSSEEGKSKDAEKSLRPGGTVD